MRKRELFHHLKNVAGAVFVGGLLPPITASAGPGALTEQEVTECLDSPNHDGMVKLYLGDASDLIPDSGAGKPFLLQRPGGDCLIVPLHRQETPYINEENYWECGEDACNLSRFYIGGKHLVRYFLDTRNQRICINLPRDPEAKRWVFWYDYDAVWKREREALRRKWDAEDRMKAALGL